MNRKFIKCHMSILNKIQKMDENKQYLVLILSCMCVELLLLLATAKINPWTTFMTSIMGELTGKF